MFVHQHRLPHLLRPHHYSSPEQFELEQESLFAPTWHLLCASAELASPGDTVAREIHGVPVLARNFDGELHAFLNVCTHRHCQIRSEHQSNSPKLTCQYHGWQYHEDGSAGAIPDAKSFRPLPGGPEKLRKYAIQQIGPLVFVCLAAEPEPLERFLGEATKELHEFPPARWHFTDHWSYELASNWKIPVENTIESYHLPIIHPHTLINYQTEELLDHELHERVTRLRCPLIQSDKYKRMTKRWARFVDPGQTLDYNYYCVTHVMPALFLIRTDITFQVMTVTPVSPVSCRLNVWLFTLTHPTEGGWFSRLVTKKWGQSKVRIIKLVLNEDLPLYERLQAGLAHSPFSGTISTREELIFHFQRFVAQRCGLKDQELTA